MRKNHHAYDPAQSHRSSLQDMKPARFEIVGASWPQAYWQNLLAETEGLLRSYIMATKTPGSDYAAARAAMQAKFYKNTQEIAATLERGYIEAEAWKKFKEENES